MNLNQLPDAGSFLFPAEWTREALLLALMSASVVIALFIYLNRRTRMPHFYLWTISWMFYMVYLAAAFELKDCPDLPALVIARRACIGISALFMFWGSFQLTFIPRNLRELKLATLMIVIWSAAAAYWVREKFWITVPLFVLLGGAGIYTGLIYWRRRKRYYGAKVLSTGFLLWGLNLIAFPFLDLSPTTLASSYVASAVLSVMIAIGMVMEEQVATADEAFRTIFDANTDAVFLIDLWTLNIVDANRNAIELTKYDLVELIGRWFPEFCPSLRNNASHDSAKNEKIFNDICKQFVEFPILRANGEQILCEGEATVVEWQRQRLLQISIRAASERKQTKPSPGTEKLSVLGLLVSSVSNRLNNHLGVITAYVQVLASHQPVDEKICQRIERIGKEAKQAASTVRDLLVFAQPSPPQRTLTDINQLLTRALQSRTLDLQMAGIKLETRLEPSLPVAQVDPSQIEQVIENLLNNAAEAMMGRTEQRTLTVTTRDCGNMIRILISDSGKGIATNETAQIFDPFFSTKLQGKGAGLGLTVSNNIIQAHSGCIRVESTSNLGSTFIIELPLLPCKLPPEIAPKPTATIPSTSRRLLIVDDEPGIIQVLQEILSGEGYTVDTALGGNDGMQLVNTTTYDLIIVDLNMPDMDGRTFYETIRKTKPDLAPRIVFMSGDTVSPNARSLLSSIGNYWLAKPFSLATAIQVVQNALSEQTQPAKTSHEKR